MDTVQGSASKIWNQPCYGTLGKSTLSFRHLCYSHSNIISPDSHVMDFNSNISLILPIKRETKEISGKLFNFQLICKTVKRQLKIHNTTTNNNHCCDYYYCCYFYYCYCCYLCDLYCLVMYSILRKSCFIF